LFQSPTLPVSCLSLEVGL